MWLVLVALAFAPGLFWGWWYYRKDVYEKEPLQLLALAFIVAAPLSLVAGGIEFVVDGGGTESLSSSPNFVVVCFFYVGVVGVLEEVLKFAAVRFTVYRHKEFNEPVDGIIYAAAAALGFATFENFFYMLNAGPAVILLRGPVSTLGHILFSAMWGYAMGIAHDDPDPANRRRLVLLGLTYAIITHGLYDILVSLGQLFPQYEWLSFSGIIFIAMLYWVVSRQIGSALRLSRFRPEAMRARVVTQARERLARMRMDRAPVQLPNYPTGDRPANQYTTTPPRRYSSQNATLHPPRLYPDDDE